MFDDYMKFFTINYSNNYKKYNQKLDHVEYYDGK